ncbi:MAG: hypothetical protein MJ113_02240 [Lachnospiraceae bacterium]|nr:hypothetical protein [Lachnospiraceae bacterium]
MSNGLKLLLIAGEVLITCIVISIGFTIANKGKENINEAVTEFESVLDEYDNF